MSDYKTVYAYNPTIGEYAGETKAYANPREGGYMMPANATETEPPEAGEHQAPVFADGAWSLVPDYRGAVYYDKSTQEKHEIKDINVEPAADWTDVEPTDRDAVWTDGAWVVPFAVLKTRKYAEIAAARWAAQTSGCAWNGHTLASDREGRSSVVEAYNIAMLAGEAYEPQLWKFVDGFATVTVNDLAAMGAALAAHVQAGFDREAALVAQIEAAETPEALAEIVWPES